MNTTTQISPRTARQSGTEYAASIERKRRRDTSGITIALVVGCFAAVAIVYAWLWGSV